jgi:hypothetical protein
VRALVLQQGARRGYLWALPAAGSWPQGAGDNAVQARPGYIFLPPVLCSSVTCRMSAIQRPFRSWAQYLLEFRVWVVGWGGEGRGGEGEGGCARTHARARAVWGLACPYAPNALPPWLLAVSISYCLLFPISYCIFPSA